MATYYIYVPTAYTPTRICGNGKSSAVTKIGTAMANYNGNTYYRYTVNDESKVSALEASSGFVYNTSASITSIYELPISSSVVYGSVNTDTYNGMTAYIFGPNTSTVNTTTNSWMTLSNLNSYYKLGQGTQRYLIQNRSTSPRVAHTTYNFDPTSSSYGVSIVELYVAAVGSPTSPSYMYTTIVPRTTSQSNYYLGTYKTCIYDFINKTKTTSDYRTRVNGNGNRRVYAIHNGVDKVNLMMTYAYSSTGSNFSDSNYTQGAYSYKKGSFNSWLSYDAGNGRRYCSITANSNNVWVSTDFTAKANYTYVLNLHTYSQANCDGIIISDQPLGSSSSVASAGLTRCSGVEGSNSYTYFSTSTKTVHIYFKTDSSYLGSYDNSTHQWSGTTWGDVEIIEYAPITITFNNNGGTGISSITVPYNSTPSISDYASGGFPPTRGSDSAHSGYTFMGYYYSTAQSGTNTQYFNSSGNWVPSYGITSGMTVYARWKPKIYDGFHDVNIYIQADYWGNGEVETDTTVSFASYYPWHNEIAPGGSDGDPSFVHFYATCWFDLGASDDPAGSEGYTTNGGIRLTLTVPAGTNPGTYPVTIEISSPSGTVNGGTYVAVNVTKTIYVNVLYKTVTYGNIQQYNYIDQFLHNIPASTCMITPSNANNYYIDGFSSIPIGQRLTYNYRDDSTYKNLGAPTVSSDDDNYLSSLGTTPTSIQTVLLEYPIHLRWTGYRKGTYKEGTYEEPTSKDNSVYYDHSIYYGYRIANNLESVSISIADADKTIPYNSTTSIAVNAIYTSGDSKDVTSDASTTISTNPSNIITIS